jgi:exonuclease SbcC
MIKRLKITNVQSHKESEFEFHPGVNIIIGDTDSGKSAIIRAIRFVKDNRPTGTSLRSNWGGETSVEIENENGTVCRSKDKIETYTIRTGRRKLVLKAFGTSVPAEVVKFLNLNELNIQYQLDSHFLLSKSSGEVASHFNRVANLSKIDTATSNINSWISKIESTITSNNELIKKNEEKLKQFDNIEKLEAEVEVLEELEEKKKNLQSKASKLYSKIVTYQNINDEIVIYKDTLELEEPINNISLLYSEKKTIHLQLVDLENLITNYDLSELDIKEKSSLIEDENLIKQLLELYNEKNTLNKQKQRLYKALNDYKSIGTLINEYEQKHEDLLQLYEKEYPNVCPFCGTKLKTK